jgi:hypothetical protein
MIEARSTAAARNKGDNATIHASSSLAKNAHAGFANLMILQSIIRMKNASRAAFPSKER